jgi:hypothetical protein
VRGLYPPAREESTSTVVVSNTPLMPLCEWMHTHSGTFFPSFSIRVFL